MKQPLHNAEDFIENLAQKLEGNFYTEPITERSEKVSLQDPYAVLLPSPDQEQEQARQNMLKAEQAEDRLASETFIDDITAAKHPGPLADEVYQDFRNH